MTEHDRLNRINEAVQPEFAHPVSTLNIGDLNEGGLRSLLRTLLPGRSEVIVSWSARDAVFLPSSIVLERSLDVWSRV